MNKQKEKIEKIDPDVTLKMSEYKTLLSYIRTMEEIAGESQNKFEVALTELLVRCIERQNGSISRFAPIKSPNPISFLEISEILTKNGLIAVRDANTSKIKLDRI